MAANRRHPPVEFCHLTRETSLAAATRNDFASITLYSPENTSRTFREVIVEVTARQSDTAATSLTSWLIGVKLGAAAFGDVTQTVTIANTGEHMTFKFQRDVTQYFNDNFGSGTSQTFQIGVQFGGAATINITARVRYEYDYDDSAQDLRIKTVRIPLDSPVGNLTNTLTEIGTNQVPDIKDLCPEASFTLRDLFFEVSGNEASTATTNFNLALGLDAEAEDQDGSHVQNLNSAVWYRYLWKRTDITVTDPHAFKARATTTSRMNCLQVVLYVTYQYSHTNSTSFLNGRVRPFRIDFEGNDSTAADQGRFKCEFWVEEPTTIALKQSGVLLNFACGAVISSINVAIGGQVARTYTHDNGTNVCGQNGLMQRFDSGGAQGSGLTLQRGRNIFTIDVFQGDTTDFMSCLTGVIYLNYTSGKASGGEGTHAASRCCHLRDHQLDAARVEISASGPTIIEPEFFVESVGLHMANHINMNEGYVSVKAEVTSSEYEGDGWRGLAIWPYNSDQEQSVQDMYADVSDHFQRWANDPDTKRLLIETARKYRLRFSATSQAGLEMWYTYHSITRKISGRIYNAEDTNNVRVDAHRADTGEKIGSDSIMTDDTYQITWYDDTIDVFAHAKDWSTSADKVGRSIDGRSLS